MTKKALFFSISIVIYSISFNLFSKKEIKVALTIDQYKQKLKISSNKYINQDYKKSIKQAKTYLFESKQKLSTSKEKVLFYQQSSIDLFTILVDKIFPFWMQTNWDFNGYTNVPNKGNIACGYLVSTTLKHIGFNLNRYKLAQQNPKNILATFSNPKVFLTLLDMQKFLNTQQNSLFLIGLDNHVGFVIRKNGKSLFYHSNYLEPSQVILENISSSPAIHASSKYFISELTNDKDLLKKWLTGVELKVVTK